MRRLWRGFTRMGTRTLPAAVAGAALIAGGIAGCVNPAYSGLAGPKGGAGPGVPAGSRPAHASLPTTPGSYLGVFEPDIPNSYRQVSRFARVLGSQPNLVLDFTYWNEPFVAAFARQAAAHGATVVIDMDPTGPSVRAIAAGNEDSYLETYANAVRAFGGPVVISFGHEMNGDWYSWGWTHTSPAVFVKAWRRIVTVFRQAGADNVTWLWTVNVISAGMPAIRDWWPGNSYVTWAGIDGYLSERYLNFGNTFAPTVSAIRKITAKPILIGETAVGQLTGQAAGIPGLFAGVAQAQLLGLIWFDEAQSGGNLAQDWRLEGHPAAEAAFHRAVARYLDVSPPSQSPDQTAALP
jgi:mannan endo-1,4-beta-mannosidase